MSATQPPHLAQHLSPFLARLDRQANALEIDPPTLSRWCLRRRSGFARRIGRAVGGDRAQALALSDEQRDVIGADRETVGALDQRFGAQRREIEYLQPAGSFLVAAATVRAHDRQHRPDDLVAGDSRDLSEAVLDDGKRSDAALDAIEIDANRRGYHRALRGLFRSRDRVVGVQALGQRIERRRTPRLQRDQIRTGRARKRKLELHAVVDRIEGA
jgi:hypothetical protein